MSKVHYTIEYNPVSETWCLFKHIESYHSYNFYSVFTSRSRKECYDKLKNILKEENDGK